MRTMHDVGEYAQPCWAVIAYRWGWINAHQYIVCVTTDLQAARDIQSTISTHHNDTQPHPSKTTPFATQATISHQP